MKLIISALSLLCAGSLAVPVPVAQPPGPVGVYAHFLQLLSPPASRNAATLGPINDSTLLPGRTPRSPLFGDGALTAASAPPPAAPGTPTGFFRPPSTRAPVTAPPALPTTPQPDAMDDDEMDHLPQPSPAPRRRRRKRFSFFPYYFGAYW